MFGVIEIWSLANYFLGVIPTEIPIIPLVYKPKVVLPNKLIIDSGRNSSK